MTNWQDNLKEIYDERLFLIEKSFNPELISQQELSTFLSKGYEVVDENIIEKSIKDTSKLIKKEVWVVRKNGTSFKQTVWVKPIEGDSKKEKKVETPVGEEISPEVKGMQIEKYSDKSILIKGDTYANLETMRKIKSELNAGVFNRKLAGWIFPLNLVDKVLGFLWSGVEDEDKKLAIQNQKNASLSEGDTVTIEGQKGEITENVSSNLGIRYNIRLEDGTLLEDVDEKVLSVGPELDDKKIQETINNAQPENRVKTEKKLYGIKPITDIHNYSLEEYMKMHGLSDEDIQGAVNMLKPKEKTGKKRSSTSSGTRKSTKGQTEGLTKRQLIFKLIHNHYQAVKSAVEAGNEVPEKVLAVYGDLQEMYAKKRKELTEEHKRKIAEALKKNKAEEEAKKFIDNLSDDELNKLKDSFKSAVSEFVKEEQSKLAEMIAEKEKLEKEKLDVYARARAETDYTKQNEIKRRAFEITPIVDKLERDIRKQTNVVDVMSNGGTLIEVTDATGVKHTRVPDFSPINTTDIDYTVENILTKEKPHYIPTINESEFESGSFIFDAIKIGKDKYLIATNKYREDTEIRDGMSVKRGGGYDTETGGFVVVTLDQLVLTQDYYVTKQKAIYRKEADEKNQRQIDHWNKFDDKRKEYYYNQRNFYQGMPAKIKKSISESEWNNLSIEEKEKIYIPVKRYNPEKIKSSFDTKHMARSFHSMYERFVNPDAKRKDRSGKILERGEVTRFQSFANPEVWDSWQNFRETLDFKINDINIQREELSEMRSKAIETSYGESGTNDILLNELGIKVKRQNGEDIKPAEIEQVKNAWIDVQSTFGTLKELAQKENLKISHAGKTYMFASKAMGVYVPRMKTIGVTAKLGEDQLGFTMGHEVAHWMDDVVGNKTGKRHASDDYESTAGKIATIFRKRMNQKSNSKYLNATHECFARSFEMYHAIEKNGKDALRAGKVRYVDAPEYVSMEAYNEIKPLIEQFLEENKDILKSFGSDLIGKYI